MELQTPDFRLFWLAGSQRIENRDLDAEKAVSARLRGHSLTTPQTNFKLVNRRHVLFSKTDRIHPQAICNDDGGRDCKRNADRFWHSIAGVS